jgi:hypothetical protein
LFHGGLILTFLKYKKNIKSINKVLSLFNLNLAAKQTQGFARPTVLGLTTIVDPKALGLVALSNQAIWILQIYLINYFIYIKNI